MFTVKQLARMAGVTARTLRYYDEIGLLRPTSIGGNGYRFYGEPALLRLQQILLYRALDVPLAEIARLLQAEDFDVLTALEQHKAALAARLSHLQELIATVDHTILHLKGASTMQAHQLFGGFRDRQQHAQDMAEAERRYGSEVVRDSQRRWNGYGKVQQAAILAEGNAIYAELVASMPAGPRSPKVQALIRRWHRHLEYFWIPEGAQLNGLAATYRDDPRFRANFDKLHPELADFMVDAVALYVDDEAPSSP